MKPSFALDFRDGQVTLLHRTSRGWQEVGSTRFDAPDLTEALAYLRSTALGLSPRGISTKLIIPNEQILYTQVTVTKSDAAKRKRQVREALEGATPYAVDDLVFDMHGTGPDLPVAAVAKETLEEAEAFAAEHRFNPVSFVAVPENGSYLSEPFFGASAMSPALLAEGDKVEHDRKPVEVVPREMPRPAKAEKAAEAAEEEAAEEAVEAAPDETVAAAETVATAEAVAEAEAAAAAGPEPDSKAEPASKPADETAAQDVSPPLPEKPEAEAGAQPWAGAKVAGTEQGLVEATAEQETEATAEPEADATAEAARQAPEPAAPTAYRPVGVINPGIDEAPMALDVPSGADAAAETESPAPNEPAVAASAGAPTPEALKRSLAAVPPEPVAAEDDLPPAPAAAVRAALAARRTQSGQGRSPSVGPAVTADRPTPPRPVGAIDIGGSQAASAKAARAKPPAPAAPTPAAIKKPSGAMVTAPGIAGDRRRKSAKNTAPLSTPRPAKPLPKPQPATGTPLMGLGGRPVPPRKPRYLGLILTGILLVFLALVAAWSSFYLAGLTGDQVPPSTTAISQATPPPSRPASATPGTVPAARPGTGNQTAAAEAASGQDARTAAVTASSAGLPTTQTSGQTSGATVEAAATAQPASTPADATTSPAGETQAAVSAPAAGTVEGPVAGTAAGTGTTQTAALQPAANLPPAPRPTDLPPPDSQHAQTVAPASTATTDIANGAASVETTSQAAQAAAAPAPGTAVSTEAATVNTPNETKDDVIAMAAVEPPVHYANPTALAPTAAEGDAAPLAAPDPPPFGTSYQFDAEGHILATPQGVVTPGGFTLIAGRPPVLPPDRPAAIAKLAPPAPAAAPTSPVGPASSADPASAVPPPQPAAAAVQAGGSAGDASTAESGATAAGVTAAQPAAENTAPGAIPLDAAAQSADISAALSAAQQSADQAGTQAETPASIPTDPAAPGFRPPPRPAALVPAAAPASDAPGPGALVFNPVASNVAVSTSSPLAVDASPVPPERPVDISAAVNSAVAAVVNSTAATANSASDAAKPAPQVTAPIPTLPTSARVTKSSTEKNALPLGRLTLVGIFGPTSDHYAYVRLANGKIEKVKIGDPLDGGTIIAISDTDLHIRKGGREIILALPHEG